MTQKEEAITFIKKYLEQSTPNFYHLIEDLVLEDEAFFIFFYEGKRFIKNGGSRLLGLPVIFFDKQLGVPVNLKDISQDHLEDRYIKHKKLTGKTITKEQASRFFQPLYEYNIQRFFDFFFPDF